MAAQKQAAPASTDESLLPPPQKKQRADGLDSRRARIAVVGAGSWSQGWHLPQLHRNPKSEVAAIVDPSTAGSWNSGSLKSTEELGKLYDVPVFSDICDLLQSDTAASVDGVLIASSHTSHYGIAIDAMKAGLHILVEKPMTVDVTQAHKLALAVASYEKTFMINNSANFRQQAIHARRLVQAGEVGAVEHVSCYLMTKMRDFLNLPSNTTWCKPSGNMLGNGFAWGQLSHTLAWVYMVTGLSPVRVFCDMNYSKSTGADLYDSASIRCSNGALVSVQGVATLPKSNESGKLVENKIFGTEGCILYCGNDEDAESGDLVLTRHDGRNQRMPGFHFENTSKEGTGPESLQAFIDGCLGNEFFNAADVTIGVKVVQTVEAMYRSAKSGCAETVVSSVGV